METKIVELTISSVAFMALTEFISRYTLRVERRMLASDAKLLIGVLKEARDSSIMFPKGKWATIQAIEADYIRDTGEQP